MSQRMNYYAKKPEAFNKFAELEQIMKESTLSHELIHLIKIRASQLNDCTYCLDMHVKEGVLDNVSKMKMFHVASWKESNLFSPKERAALMWCDALTHLSFESTRDEIYGQVREYFDEKELIDLSLSIALINTWNRFGVAFRVEPGSTDKGMGLDKAEIN